MKSYALPLLVFAGLTFGLAAVSVTTPEWTKKAGLDFWNFDTEKDRLGVADLEGRHLNAIRERQAERIAVSDYLASDLCENRITLDESLDILTGVAHDDPDWFATLRDLYCLYGYLPQAVADRDVLACYLRITIAGKQGGAEHSNDRPLAATIQKRLARLDEELRLRGSPVTPGLSPPAEHSQSNAMGTDRDASPWLH